MNQDRNQEDDDIERVTSVRSASRSFTPPLRCNPSTLRPVARATPQIVCRPAAGQNLINPHQMRSPTDGSILSVLADDFWHSNLRRGRYVAAGGLLREEGDRSSSQEALRGAAQRACKGDYEPRKIETQPSPAK